MKKELLKEIIEKKEKKIEFAIITNLKNGECCIFEKNKPLDKNFEKYKDKITSQFNKKKNGVIENSNIFVENYIKPIKVIVVGAVHIAQYLVNFSKSLNFFNRRSLTKFYNFFCLVNSETIVKFYLNRSYEYWTMNKCLIQ